MRYSGQVFSRLPADAPLALTLPAEVYALDGFTEFGSAQPSDYIVTPGARLEVGPEGKLYETMGMGDDVSAVTISLSPWGWAALGAAVGILGYKILKARKVL